MRENENTNIHDVCEWVGEEYCTYTTSCESEHDLDPHKAPFKYCPSCSKPIKIME